VAFKWYDNALTVSREHGRASAARGRHRVRYVVLRWFWILGYSGLQISNISYLSE